MQFSIRHKTSYRYETPVGRSIHYIRTFPLSGPTQSVIDWRLEGFPDKKRWTDAYGNEVATLVIADEHDRLDITVLGRVETRDTAGVYGYGPDAFPDAYWCCPTHLTKPSGKLLELAETFRPKLDGDRLDLCHTLMRAVAERVAYVKGTSDTQTTAALAFEAGSGVCQDHAHVMISLARALGLPARYVSGYLYGEIGASGPAETASHAWSEIMVPDLGWVGFDPANEICPTDHHVRIAVGLDYSDCAPVTGVRFGGTEAELSVEVAVTPLGGVNQ